MSRRSAWLVFGALLICYGYFFPRWADWNQNSRLDQILAVVDQGTFAIDQYHQNTGDYALYNGHYYSDKAPGTALLGIPVYWLFRNLLGRPFSEQILSRLASNSALSATLNQAGTGPLAEKLNFFVALVLVTFFVVAVPSSLLGVLHYRLFGYFTSANGRRIGLALALGLATPAFAYANSFYGHQVAGVCLFAAFYFLFETAHASPPAGVRRRARLLLMVGFLATLAVITEYPTALIAAGLGLYALAEFPYWSTLPWIALGGSVPALFAAMYNLLVFGSPLSLGYAYSTLWQSTHQVGFFSVSVPTPDALWGITFSPYRGLFFLSPFLLFALPGLYLWAREGKYRREFWLVLWCLVSFFAFNSGSAMWAGGFAVGPRYLLPMLPFLGLPIIFFMNRLESRVLRAVTWLAVCWSAIAVWVETLGGQMFPQFQLAPLWEYSIERVAAGDIARNAGMILGLGHWASLLPLLVLGAGVGVLALRESFPRIRQTLVVSKGELMVPSERD
jgi:hypothetical protein